MSEKKVKIRITADHLVNFGTGDKPDYKKFGDVVTCDKKVADGLVKEKLAEFLEGAKEEN